jgi:hypothetical protein
MGFNKLFGAGHLVLGACPLLLLCFLAHPASPLKAEDKKAERPIVKFMGIKEGGGGELCQTLQAEFSKTCEVLYLPVDRGGDRISFRGGDGSLYYVAPNKIKIGTINEINRLLKLPFREKVDGVEEEIN